MIKIFFALSIVSITLLASYLPNQITSSSAPLKLFAMSELNCDSSSSIVRQEGSWVSSIGNVSSSACTVTIATGAFSATPYCWGQKTTTGPNDYITRVTATSATSVIITCEDDASGGCSAIDFILFCIGTK